MAFYFCLNPISFINQIKHVYICLDSNYLVFTLYITTEIYSFGDNLTYKMQIWMDRCWLQLISKTAYRIIMKFGTDVEHWLLTFFNPASWRSHIQKLVIKLKNYNSKNKIIAYQMDFQRRVINSLCVSQTKKLLTWKKI